MIEFYGSPMSSAGRTHIMLEETGVPYHMHVVNTRDPAALAAFRRDVFAGGKIPYLIDGDVTLFESIAINFYLAERYRPEMWADTPGVRAQIYQWSLWAITNLQPEALRAMSAAMGRGGASPDEVAAAKQAAQRYVDQLEPALASGFLVGGRYTVADLNVASIVNVSERAKAAALGPHARTWLDGFRARPAFRKATGAPA